MKVLFLPQTGQLGPASRYRVYQLVPHLEKLGIVCEISPAVDDMLYRQIYLEGNRAARAAAFRATRDQRKRDLARIGEFDAVFVQKGFFPGLYSGLEQKMAARKPLVFDFDDAIWLPREGGSTILRLLHRESAVQTILRCAAAVTAGNEFLADYARRFNKNVHVIPSAIDLAFFPSPSSVLRPPSSVIGWIGSRTTLPYLKPLKPVFEKLYIKPRVIASGDPSALGFPVEFRQWRLETESEELGQIGIGISPLPDTPWEHGKCGVKLLQFMACGIPVVASPVGVHKEMIRHGENGFLAASEAEWIEYLNLLVTSPDLRARLGAAGRKLVEEKYSLAKITPQMADGLHSAVQR